jgi:hypothetical protein
LPDRPLEGRVDLIASIAQTVNGQQMFVVRSEVKNENNLLKPEMMGYARIYAGERRVIDLMTRRVIKWVKTDFLHLLPW